MSKKYIKDTFSSLQERFRRLRSCVENMSVDANDEEGIDLLGRQCQEFSRGYESFIHGLNDATYSAWKSSQGSPSEGSLKGDETGCRERLRKPGDRYSPTHAKYGERSQDVKRWTSLRSISTKPEKKNEFKKCEIILISSDDSESAQEIVVVSSSSRSDECVTDDEQELETDTSVESAQSSAELSTEGENGRPFLLEPDESTTSCGISAWNDQNLTTKHEKCRVAKTANPEEKDQKGRILHVPEESCVTRKKPTTEKKYQIRRPTHKASSVVEEKPSRETYRRAKFPELVPRNAKMRAKKIKRPLKTMEDSTNSGMPELKQDDQETRLTITKSDDKATASASAGSKPCQTNTVQGDESSVRVQSDSLDRLIIRPTLENLTEEKTKVVREPDVEIQTTRIKEETIDQTDKSLDEGSVVSGKSSNLALSLMQVSPLTSPSIASLEGRKIKQEPSDESATERLSPSRSTSDRDTSNGSKCSEFEKSSSSAKGMGSQSGRGKMDCMSKHSCPGDGELTYSLNRANDEKRLGPPGTSSENDNGNKSSASQTSPVISNMDSPHSEESPHSSSSSVLPGLSLTGESVEKVQKQRRQRLLDDADGTGSCDDSADHEKSNLSDLRHTPSSSIDRPRKPLLTSGLSSENNVPGELKQSFDTNSGSSSLKTNFVRPSDVKQDHKRKLNSYEPSQKEKRTTLTKSVSKVNSAYVFSVPNIEDSGLKKKLPRQFSSSSSGFLSGVGKSKNKEQVMMHSVEKNDELSTHDSRNEAPGKQAHDSFDYENGNLSINDSAYFSRSQFDDSICPPSPVFGNSRDQTPKVPTAVVVETERITSPLPGDAAADGGKSEAFERTRVVASNLESGSSSEHSPFDFTPSPVLLRGQQPTVASELDSQQQDEFTDIPLTSNQCPVDLFSAPFVNDNIRPHLSRRSKSSSTGGSSIASSTANGESHQNPKQIKKLAKLVPSPVLASSGRWEERTPENVGDADHFKEKGWSNALQSPSPPLQWKTHSRDTPTDGLEPDVGKVSTSEGRSDQFSRSVGQKYNLGSEFPSDVVPDKESSEAEKSESLDSQNEHIVPSPCVEDRLFDSPSDEELRTAGECENEVPVEGTEADRPVSHQLPSDKHSPIRASYGDGVEHSVSKSFMMYGKEQKVRVARLKKPSVVLEKILNRVKRSRAVEVGNVPKKRSVLLELDDQQKVKKVRRSERASAFVQSEGRASSPEYEGTYDFQFNGEVDGTLKRCSQVNVRGRSSRGRSGQPSVRGRGSSRRARQPSVRGRGSRGRARQSGVRGVGSRGRARVRGVRKKADIYSDESDVLSSVDDIFEKKARPVRRRKPRKPSVKSQSKCLENRRSLRKSPQAVYERVETSPDHYRSSQPGSPSSPCISDDDQFPRSRSRSHNVNLSRFREQWKSLCKGNHQEQPKTPKRYYRLIQTSFKPGLLGSVRDLDKTKSVVAFDRKQYPHWDEIVSSTWKNYKKKYCKAPFLKRPKSSNEIDVYKCEHSPPPFDTDEKYTSNIPRSKKCIPVYLNDPSVKHPNRVKARKARARYAWERGGLLWSNWKRRKVWEKPTASFDEYKKSFNESYRSLLGQEDSDLEVSGLAMDDDNLPEDVSKVHDPIRKHLFSFDSSDLDRPHGRDEDGEVSCPVVTGEQGEGAFGRLAPTRKRSQFRHDSSDLGGTPEDAAVSGAKVTYDKQRVTKEASRELAPVRKRSLIPGSVSYHSSGLDEAFADEEMSEPETNAYKQRLSAKARKKRKLRDSGVCMDQSSIFGGEDISGFELQDGHDKHQGNGGLRSQFPEKYDLTSVVSFQDHLVSPMMSKNGIDSPLQEDSLDTLMLGENVSASPLPKKNALFSPLSGNDNLDSFFAEDSFDSLLRGDNGFDSFLQGIGELSPSLLEKAPLKSHIPGSEKDCLDSTLPGADRMDSPPSREDVLLPLPAGKDSFMSPLPGMYRLDLTKLRRVNLGSPLQRKNSLGSPLLAKDNLESPLPGMDRLGSPLPGMDSLGSSLQGKDGVESRLPEKNTLRSVLSEKDSLGTPLQEKNSLGPASTESDRLRMDGLGSPLQEKDSLDSALTEKDKLGSPLRGKDSVESASKEKDSLGSELSPLPGKDRLGLSLPGKDCLRSLPGKDSVVSSPLPGKHSLGSPVQGKYSLGSPLPGKGGLGSVNDNLESSLPSNDRLDSDFLGISGLGSPLRRDGFDSQQTAGKTGMGSPLPNLDNLNSGALPEKDRFRCQQRGTEGFDSPLSSKDGLDSPLLGNDSLDSLLLEMNELGSLVSGDDDVTTKSAEEDDLREVSLGTLLPLTGRVCSPLPGNDGLHPPLTGDYGFDCAMPGESGSVSPLSGSRKDGQGSSLQGAGGISSPLPGQVQYARGSSLPPVKGDVDTLLPKYDRDVSPPQGEGKCHSPHQAEDDLRTVENELKLDKYQSPLGEGEEKERSPSASQVWDSGITMGFGNPATDSSD